MKKLLPLLALLLLVLFINIEKATAQQKPYFTQYILNNYILNPALSGIENYIDLKMSYRRQWAGIPGAPITTYVSIQGPIGKTDYRTSATSYQMPGENTRGRKYWDEEYQPAEPHHGIGFIAMDDKTGYLDRISVYGTYAYHMGISPTTSLAAGFLAGITNVNLDRSKVFYGDPNDPSIDQNDPAIGYGSGQLSKFTPEVGAGLWMYSPDFFAGLSVLNIVPGKISFSTKNAFSSYYTPQFLGTAGYKFFLNDDVTILPSFMAQFIQPFPVQVHINVKAQYQDLLWVGASYRISDQVGGYAAMAGFNIGNTLNVGYAYDVSTTSRLQSYSHNSHEIIIGFLINNKYGDTCPRNLW
jgi:type IX secretion system PorP/SprF family membrane protein